jgi:hypothetical protein
MPVAVFLALLTVPGIQLHVVIPLGRLFRCEIGFCLNFGPSARIQTLFI